MSQDPTPSTFTQQRTKPEAQSVPGFEALALENYGRVFGVGLAWLRDPDAAQDLTQEVLLRAYLHLRTGAHIENFPGWCGTVARNLAANWLRDGKRKSALLEKLHGSDAQMQNSSTPSTPRHTAQLNEEAEQLQRALATLQPALREVVILHYMEGCSRSEVARITSQHPSSVGRAIDRALRELRVTLEEAPSRFGAIRVEHQHGKNAALLVAGLTALNDVAIASLAAHAADTTQLLLPTGTVTRVAATGGMKAAITAALASPYAGAALIGCTAAAIAMGAFALPRLTGGKLSTRSVAHSNQVTTQPDARSVSVSQVKSPTPRSFRQNRTATAHPAFAAATSQSLPFDALARYTAQLPHTSPWLTPVIAFQVINEEGLPISNATAYIKEFWYEQVVPKGHTHGQYPPPMLTQSDALGSFTLSLPKFPAESPRAWVTLHVEHTDYATTEAKVELKALNPIVMNPGNSLAVRPLFENGEPVPAEGTHIFTGASAQVTSATWTARRDGTLLAPRLANGTHLLYARHKSSDGETYYSPITSVTLPRTEKAPLEVTVLPTFTLRGSIDPQVPRPIVKGQVEVRSNNDVVPVHPAPSTTYVHNIETQQRTKGIFYRHAKGEIRADGSFEVPGLPQADLRILASCDGWISTNDAMTTFPYSWYTHRVTYPGDSPITVPMTKTGNVLVRVTANSGTVAVSSATVTAQSSIYWNTFGDVEHTWTAPGNSAVTDQSGRALITNLYPMAHSFNADHPDYVSYSTASDSPEELWSNAVRVISGETVEFELDVRPKDAPLEAWLKQ